VIIVTDLIILERFAGKSMENQQIGSLEIKENEDIQQANQSIW